MTFAGSAMPNRCDEAILKQHARSVEIYELGNGPDPRANRDVTAIGAGGRNKTMKTGTLEFKYIYSVFVVKLLSSAEKLCFTN